MLTLEQSAQLGTEHLVQVIRDDGHGSHAARLVRHSDLNGNEQIEAAVLVDVDLHLEMGERSLRRSTIKSLVQGACDRQAESSRALIKQFPRID